MLRVCLFLLLLVAPHASLVHAEEPPVLSVMAWNIWHGGREDGEQLGPQKVIEIIRESGADLIAMQETYGSGELISDALGFHFHPRGTNVSIHSRWPIVEDLSVFEEFKCVGALIELPDRRRVAFFSIWLPYSEDIWIADSREELDVGQLLAACEPSRKDLDTIKRQIHARLDKPQYAEVPIIIAGDFNSMSHRDYIESAHDQYDVVIDWPTSHVLTDDGYRDAWRETNPEVNRQADRTWSPRFTDQEQDRIDFIYYRGGSLQAFESRRIDTFRDGFPSDHAAVVTRFDWPTPDAAARQLRTVSYNIKHGLGNDGRIDLERTAELLRNLGPDIVGLQEVDLNARRSGQIDQAKYLGEQLGLNSAFGKFMDFQGGQYGMAMLSRHPIEEVREIALPEGNEPRIALACKIQIPDDEPLWVVNVHFDWIADDTVRFEQASRLAEHLADLDRYLLLGDFNDVAGSRTLDLLSATGLPETRPPHDRFTFSATNPAREIDFIYCFPGGAWQVNRYRVIPAPLTSDHRPVLAVLERQ